jgi:YlmC/YmxH family sporulation protein
MRVSYLQIKDVVSLTDGKRLGRIVDIDIQDNGLINYFIVEQRRFFRFFGTREEVSVGINQIKKIGTDVILVEI